MPHGWELRSCPPTTSRSLGNNGQEHLIHKRHTEQKSTRKWDVQGTQRPAAPELMVRWADKIGTESPECPEVRPGGK